MDKLKLAKWIRDAMAARENSFDTVASAQAQENAYRERELMVAAGDKHAYMYGIVDHAKFYRMTQREAVESVVPAEFVEPVYLLLVTAWNDIQGWCDDVEGIVRPARSYAVTGTEADSDSHVMGGDYNFETTFDPGTPDEKKCQTQVWAPNMLHAAFQVGQLFAEKFATDFTVVPIQPVILKLEKVGEAEAT
jgi:hypothetical protein